MAIIETKVVDQQADRHCHPESHCASVAKKLLLYFNSKQCIWDENPLLLLKTPQSYKTKEANQGKKKEKKSSRQSQSKDTDKSDQQCVKTSKYQCCSYIIKHVKVQQENITDKIGERDTVLMEWTTIIKVVDIM